MTAPADADLVALAARLVTVPGVEGVVLGGSRARGTHVPESDVDLGLYYTPPLDLAALGALAREVAGPDAAVTEPGAWGPWVDGGAWLRIGGHPVDWIYRDLARVERSVAEAVSGGFAWHHQTGHPLGVPSFLYAAELATGRILADPAGHLASLRARVGSYPPRLAEEVARGGLWESGFALDLAGKAVSRNDVAYVSGCLFRAVLLLAHVLHARAGVWLVTEKGAVAAAAALPVAPPDLAERAAAAFASLGPAPADLAAAIDAAARLRADLARAAD